MRELREAGDFPRGRNSTSSTTTDIGPSRASNDFGPVRTGSRKSCGPKSEDAEVNSQREITHH